MEGLPRCLLIKADKYRQLLIIIIIIFYYYFILLLFYLLKTLFIVGT